jgi:uncharacterized protein (DUF4415 family)
MSERKRVLGSNLRKIDAHQITQEEYDEVPELTEEWFESADLHIGGKLVRKGTRGRPKKADAKVSVHLRLSPDVLAHFRARGPGWQTRIDETLRKALKLKERKKSAAK